MHRSKVVKWSSSILIAELLRMPAALRKNHKSREFTYLCIENNLASSYNYIFIMLFSQSRYE